jgi:hypothetical protein
MPTLPAPTASTHQGKLCSEGELCARPADRNPHPPPCGSSDRIVVVWRPLCLRKRANCALFAGWQRNLDNHEATAGGGGAGPL